MKKHPVQYEPVRFVLIVIAWLPFYWFLDLSGVEIWPRFFAGFLAVCAWTVGLYLQAWRTDLERRSQSVK